MQEAIPTKVVNAFLKDVRSNFSIIKSILPPRIKNGEGQCFEKNKQIRFYDLKKKHNEEFTKSPLI